MNKTCQICDQGHLKAMVECIDVECEGHYVGLNQEQAAKVFGGGPEAFSKYKSDDVMQSDSADKLLRMAEAFPMRLKKLMQQAGI